MCVGGLVVCVGWLCAWVGGRVGWGLDLNSQPN